MSVFTAISRYAAIATVVSATTISSAYALPAFTFNPFAAGFGTASSGAAFTADNMIIQDFSTVAFSSVPNNTTPSNFSDNGFLYVQTFQLANTNLVQPALNASGGYGFYFKFQATGVQNPIASNGTATGSFTGVAFQFYGYSQGASAPVFSVDGTTTTNVGTPTLLASGAINGGSVIINYNVSPALPAAFPLGSFTPAAGETAFFSSPSPFYNILSASFTNTQQVITTTPTGFTINGGGGNANFIPEPSTLALIAAGIAALGFVRRRRAV